METKATTAKTAKAMKFPRDVVLVNDSPRDFVIARTPLPANSKASVNVKDEDELTRLKTDCKHLVELLDNKDAEKAPIRVEEA